MAFLLLDTCAVIWLTNKEPLSFSALEAIHEAVEASEPIFVSPVSAWEIGLLVSRNRLRSQTPVQTWFDDMLNLPGIALANLRPAVLIASSYLPGTPPRDPADRIMAATARAHGYRLMTRDRRLLEYGAEGHLQVVSC